MTDAVVIEIVTGTFSVITACFGSYMSYLMVKMNRGVRKNARDMKTALANTEASTHAKLDAMAKTGERTHALVNSSNTNQLKLFAIALNKIAELTKNPEDIEAAKTAEDNFKTQEFTQEKVI